MTMAMNCDGMPCHAISSSSLVALSNTKRLPKWEEKMRPVVKGALFQNHLLGVEAKGDGLWTGKNQNLLFRRWTKLKHCLAIQVQVYLYNLAHAHRRGWMSWWWLTCDRLPGLSGCCFSLIPKRISSNSRPRAGLPVVGWWLPRLLAHLRWLGLGLKLRRLRWLRLIRSHWVGHLMREYLVWLQGPVGSHWYVGGDWRKARARGCK